MVHKLRKSSLFTHQNDERCPECQGKLVIRRGVYGLFQRCEHYPECHYSHSLQAINNDNPIIKIIEDEPCPLCQAHLAIKQGRYGLFIGCLNYPTCVYVVSTKPENETIIHCPKCSIGQLVQRTSRFGKIFYGCDHYPTCQFTLTNKPIQGNCPVCRYPLLIEKPSKTGIKYYCANKTCHAEVKSE